MSELETLTKDVENPRQVHGENVYKKSKNKKIITKAAKRGLVQEFLSSKINRNSSCPCGSGLKYKRCCL